MAQDSLSLGLMGAGQLFSGFTEAQALRMDAERDRENARLALLDGALAGADLRRRSRALQGDAIAAAAANGVAIGTGSALDQLTQNAVNTELAVLNQQYESRTRARAHEVSARGKRHAATNAIIGSFVRAGTSIVTGQAEIGRAERIGAAGARVREGQLPGGLRLPVPVTVSRGDWSLPPWHRGGLP